MSLRTTFVCTAALGLLLAAAPGCSGGAGPSHPRTLRYPAMQFSPPYLYGMREQMANGMIVYCLADPSAPLVRMTLYLPSGSLFDPKEKRGLAETLAALLKRGGTSAMTVEQIDAALADRGAALLGDAGRDLVWVGASCMPEDSGFLLDLFTEVALRPAFRAEELERFKAETVERLARRNDEPRAVAGREFARLVYGNHPAAWNTTKTTLTALSVEDLKAAHAAAFHPEHAVLAVSGAFDRDAMLGEIQRHFGDWPKGAAALPPVADVEARPEPALHVFQKETNQGYVVAGHLGVLRDNPDWHALQVMNFILGGGSFTSRITSRVRSDEGLAYHASSTFGADYLVPGLFTVQYQSKSMSVAYALKLVQQELERIRTQPVTAHELDVAKASLIERFPSVFATPHQVVTAYAELEARGQALDYYRVYREKVDAVTVEKVQEVARRYLDPARIVTVIVGPRDTMVAGDETHPVTLPDLGDLHMQDLMDPLSDEF